MVFLPPLLNKEGLGEVLLRLHESPSILLVQTGDMGDRCSETWVTPLYGRLAPFRRRLRHAMKGVFTGDRARDIRQAEGGDPAGVPCLAAVPRVLAVGFASLLAPTA